MRLTRRELFGLLPAGLIGGHDYEVERLRHEVRALERTHQQDKDEMKEVIVSLLQMLWEQDMTVFYLDDMMRIIGDMVLLNHERLKALEYEYKTPEMDTNKQKPT